MKRNILAENMRRFGTKNLNEDFDQNNNGYPDGTENNWSQNYKKNWSTNPETRDKPINNYKLVQQLSKQAFQELFGYAAINSYSENGIKFTDRQLYNDVWKTNKNFAKHILRTVSNLANKKGLEPIDIMVNFIKDNVNGINGETHAVRTYKKYFELPN